MDAKLIAAKFERLGARAKVVMPEAARRNVGSFRLDIREDRRGEFFEIRLPAAAPPELLVLDLQPDRRHLLLLARVPEGKSKYLCGHDERHWFVAGVPEAAPVGTVRQAMEALKPRAVRDAQARAGVSGDDGFRRRNAAFVRQGEWFFLPEPGFDPGLALVRRNEPLVRSTGGKPHWAEFCCRSGGESVLVSSAFPGGLSEEQHRALLERRPAARNWSWRPMRRNPAVYVRGRVRHADHATLLLPGWHRVLMNTEGESRAMRNVAFLD